MTTFPIINLDLIENLTAEEKKIVELCLNSRDGRLRKSKPKLKFEVYEHKGRKYACNVNLTGEAAYVWRFLAFYLSAERPYCCMPVMAEFDLPIRMDDEDRFEKTKEMKKRMDALMDKVLDSLPRNELRGLRRWGGVLS